MAFPQHRYHLTPVTGPSGCGLRDCGFDRGLYFDFVELPRQKTFDYRDLFALLANEVGAVTLLVECRRFAPLLDHRLQHPAGVVVGDAVAVTLSARRDVPLLELGEDHADGRNRTPIPGPHRLLEPLRAG